MRNPIEQSDPDRNFNFRRKWDERPMRLEVRQANAILTMIRDARTLAREGRTQQADDKLSDAEFAVMQHRDRHHDRLRMEAGLEQRNDWWREAGYEPR